jgi:hypothetical protein
MEGKSPNDALSNGLKRTGADLEKVQRLARIGTWEWEVQTGKAVWSEETHRIFGVQGAEPSYELAKSLVHPSSMLRAGSLPGIEPSRK